MKKFHVSLLGALLAATSLFAVGCTKHVKKDTIEASIKSAFEKQGVAFKSVACPGDREVKAGDKFECTGELAEGGKASIAVTQKNDQGHFEFDIAGLILKESSISDQLTKAIGTKIEAKCAKKLAILRKGEVFTCEYKAGEAMNKLELTCADDEKSAKAKTTSAGQEVAAAPAPTAEEAPPVEADEAVQ